MRKSLFLLTCFLCLTTIIYAGGIITNANQSAAYTRMLVRDASTDIDAVYFNPAGLFRLNNGFHISLNNQTILQNKDVTEEYVFLNSSPKKYPGKITVPFFPSIYGVWKTGKFAFSVGINPIGGGGGAELEKGLPSFENGISHLVPMLQSSLTPLDNALTAGYGFDPKFRNISTYDANIYFKGTSVFLGFQGGVSYQLNEILSLFAGARYVSAKNTYTGYIRDVNITVAPTTPPSTLFYDIPAGDYTPGNYLRAVAGALGVPPQNAAGLNATAGALDVLTAVEADVEETGNGITPIIGASLTFGERFNIGLKYEFKTTMELTQTINDGKDANGMFVQDSTVHSDMPAMFSIGVGYKILPKLSAQAGVHYYFDKDANYGKTLDETGEAVTNDKVIDKNYLEAAIGFEYNLTDKFLVSAGYLLAKTGVTADYQSDLSFSLSSNTFGLGAAYDVASWIRINVGASYSIYEEGTKAIKGLTPATVPTLTFNKDTFLAGIGVDINL